MTGNCSKRPAACRPAAGSRQAAADVQVCSSPGLWQHRPLQQSGGLCLNGASTICEWSWRHGSMMLVTWWSSWASRRSTMSMGSSSGGANISLLHFLGAAPHSLSDLSWFSVRPPPPSPSPLPSLPPPAHRSCSQAPPAPCSTQGTHGGEGVKLHTVPVSDNNLHSSFLSFRASKQETHLKFLRIRSAVGMSIDYNQHSADVLQTRFCRPLLRVRWDCVRINACRQSQYVQSSIAQPLEVSPVVFNLYFFY